MRFPRNKIRLLRKCRSTPPHAKRRNAWFLDAEFARVRLRSLIAVWKYLTEGIRQECSSSSRGCHRRISGLCRRWWLSHGTRVLLIAVPAKRVVAD